MDKSTDNAFLRTAFGGEIQIPSTSRSPSPRLNISAKSSSHNMFTKNSETKLKLLESSMNSKMIKLGITNCVFITYVLFNIPQGCNTSCAII